MPASRPARLCYATSGHSCKLCIYSTEVHNSFGHIYRLLRLSQVWPTNSAKERLDSPALGCICGHLEDLYVAGRYQVDIKWGMRECVLPVAYPRILFGGGSTNSVEDRGQRERGSGGGSPLVRGSGGSCSLVQEIPFHIVKDS